MDYIEPILFTDPQCCKEKHCPRCGGCIYPPGYHCPRCEKEEQT